MSRSDFQDRVWNWSVHCFGSRLTEDWSERAPRFLEESLELGQAAGLTKEDALKLVDYVYDRPAGKVEKEIGGVLITLAILAGCAEVDMMRAGEDELLRNWMNIQKIRHKNENLQKEETTGSSIGC